MEARLVAHVHVGERRFGDVGHVCRALDEAANLARRLSDRPSDLARELGGDVVLLGGEALDERASAGDALGERYGTPAALGLPGAGCRSVQRGEIGELALDEERTIDRSEGALYPWHVDSTGASIGARSLAHFEPAPRLVGPRSSRYGEHATPTKRHAHSARPREGASLGRIGYPLIRAACSTGKRRQPCDASSSASTIFPTRGLQPPQPVAAPQAI